MGQDRREPIAWGSLLKGRILRRPLFVSPDNHAPVIFADLSGTERNRGYYEEVYPGGELRSLFLDGPE